MERTKGGDAGEISPMILFLLSAWFKVKLEGS